MSKIELAGARVSISVLIAARREYYFEQSHRITSHRGAERSRTNLCVREPRERERESRTRETGSFCFSTAGSRDAFGSRFDHIKRQMSFYGGHRHPWTACRERRGEPQESGVSYARTFLVPDAGDALLSSPSRSSSAPSVRTRAFD